MNDDYYYQDSAIHFVLNFFLVSYPDFEWLWTGIQGHKNYIEFQLLHSFVYEFLQFYVIGYKTSTIEKNT